MDGTDQPIRYPWPDPPDPGQAIALAEGVLWLRLPLPMALDHVNVYALDDGDGWTLIDAGIDSRKSRAAWAELLAGPLAGKPVRRVVCTHHHPDHVGLAGWFQQGGAELAMPRTGWLMARMLQLEEQASYPPEAITFYTRAGMDAEILAARGAERPFNFADCTTRLPLGFTRLQEGQVIRMGGRDWDIRMGHGHAPEQATFWSRDCDLVLGADQLLPSISPNIGVYPTEPEADPLADWLDSCARFQTIAEDRHVVLGGHKLPFTGLPLRLRQMIDNPHGALDRLRDAIRSPKRAGDCFLPIFKREITGGQYGLALVEALAHLNHLHQTGQASRTLRADGAWWFKAP